MTTEEWTLFMVTMLTVHVFTKPLFVAWMRMRDRRKLNRAITAMHTYAFQDIWAQPRVMKRKEDDEWPKDLEM